MEREDHWWLDMGKEDRWWTKPLAHDIFTYLKEKETNRPPYLRNSPQLDERRYLVDWLALIWEQYDLRTTTRQLAVTLLDFFMDQYNIEAEQLRLVALGSLLVAAKFEEQETNIPRLYDLNKYVPEPGYSSEQYLQVELLLLKFYDWNVSIPTAAHFTEYFLQFAQDKTKVIESRKHPKRSAHYQDHLTKYTAYFLEICMQDHIYRDYCPSRVAAACVVSSRICLNMHPGLNEELEKATLYSWDQLSHLVETMLRTHHEDEQQTGTPTPPPTPKHTHADQHMAPQMTSEMTQPAPTVYFVNTPRFQLVTSNGICSLVPSQLWSVD